MYLTRSAKRKLPEYAEQVKLEENKLKEKNKPKPPILFEGKYKYETDFIGCAVISDELLDEAEKTEDLLVIGFDLEWPFSYETGPGKTALIQMCTSANDQMVYMLHVTNLTKLPAVLVKLLSHPKVRIAGVNIRNDVHKLCRDFSIAEKEIILANCVDSRTQAKELTSITGWSMEKLVNHFFGKSISKDKKVRNSKWHILPLSKVQLLYAATDAYVSLKLYTHLKEEAKKPQIEEDPLLALL
ncbi:WRN exonuclease [Carabus blaptoides fortunei]